MAYSSSPQYSTYKSVPIPFNGVQNFRSGDLTNQRDLQIVNAYYDRVSQENQKRTVALKKRPGMGVSSYSLTKNVNTDSIRGYYNDTAQNAFYWAVNNHLYYLKPDSSSVPTLLATLNTSSGYVGFTGYLKSTNTRFVILSDGTDLWVHDIVGATCTRVTDVDLPTPHQPYPIYLDGYVFLIKTNTCDLYNSDVDDATSWTAGNFITCEMNNDFSLRPIKLKNYIGVMGSKSTEYFYDNANATGSPMSRYDSAYNSIGYVTGGCQIGDTFYFIGQDQGQNLCVYQVNSFKTERISNSVVDSTLQAFSSTSNTKGRVALTKDSHCISVDGHNFLVVPATQTTWVYDIDEKFWYEWKGSDGNGLAVEAAMTMYNGGCYVAITNQTTLSIMSPSLYQDFNSNYTVRYTTDQFTADSANWKFGYRFLVIADQDQSTVGVSSTIAVTWSDDDWASDADDGTGITRNLQLFTDSPYIRGLGRFRQRTFRLEYADNYPLRITSVMIDINVGIV